MYDVATMTTEQPLSSLRRQFISQGELNWHRFLQNRKERLVQASRPGGGCEKITENILEDLFTKVLGWPISCINNQINYADIVLTKLGIKQLIIETKRPNYFAAHADRIGSAREQAWRYAEKQKVTRIAICDSYKLYAFDLINGGCQERVAIHLDNNEFSEDLWWISVNGIYRPRKNYQPTLNQHGNSLILDHEPLHPKYKLPARCFAYVDDVNQPKTWKLPYLTAKGNVDQKRITGAIRCIVSNYRGANVKNIPESAIPDVLKKLYQAAHDIKKLPEQNPKTSRCYYDLSSAIKQCSA